MVGLVAGTRSGCNNLYIDESDRINIYTSSNCFMMSSSITPSNGNNNPCDGRNTTGSIEVPVVTSGLNDDDQADSEAVTCSVLCSLMSSTRPPRHSVTSSTYNEHDAICDKQDYQSFDNDCDAVSLSRSSDCKRRSNADTCTDHLQLPMFLSKTYHMIDRCDDEIATWSEKGDNFVVKNVEKFASHVLPLYFKHSNFSSFARQLNFYGFRKLRTDPILTSDVDPCTSCYVRFFHERFQRGKPELLQQIKRATKNDQHSKDDVESLRNEISDLKDLIRSTVEDYDRKLAELSYECNRRITAMNAEYDNLAVLVHRVIGSIHPSSGATPSHTNASSSPASLSRQNTQCRATELLSTCPSLRHSFCSAMKATPFPATTTNPVNMPASAPSLHSDLLHSLSQAAVSIQNTLLAQQKQQQNAVVPTDCGKRANYEPTDNATESSRSSCRRKTDK